MPLQSRWIDEIMARLAVRYGSRWSSLWQGVDPELVRADWAEQLDGMTPESIRKALDSLPDDFPPTATAFRKAGAIRQESRTVPALPAPDPEGAQRVAETMAGVSVLGERPREWMVRLQRDVIAGTASHSRKEHYQIAVKNGYFGEAQEAPA